MNASDSWKRFGNKMIKSISGRSWSSCAEISKEQLRSEELLLLQPAGASSSPLNLLWLLPGISRPSSSLLAPACACRWISALGLRVSGSRCIVSGPTTHACYTAHGVSLPLPCLHILIQRAALAVWVLLLALLGGRAALLALHSCRGSHCAVVTAAMTAT